MANYKKTKGFIKTGTKNRYPLMRVSAELENLLYRINKERKCKGLKRIPATKLTKYIAKKYLKEEMFTNEFFRV